MYEANTQEPAQSKEGIKIIGLFSLFTSHKALSLPAIDQTQPKGGRQTDWKMLNTCSSPDATEDRRVKRNASEESSKSDECTKEESIMIYILH